MKFSVSIAISLTSTERPEQDSVGKFFNTVEELRKTERHYGKGKNALTLTVFCN